MSGLLSRAQIRFWLGDRLNGAGRIVVVYELRGPLNPQTLARAVDDVVERHETVRCAYDLGESDVACAPADPPRLLVTDVSPGGGVDEAITLIDRLVRLDMINGQVFWPVLVRVAPRLHVLGLGVHHIAFDGGSEVVMLRDLSTAYRARLDGDRPRWSAPVPYADFVAWERDELAASGYAAHVEHWRRSLAGGPMTDTVAAAFGGGGEEDREVGTTEYVLDPARTAACLRRAGGARCSPGMYMLAVQLRVLADATGNADLVIGCELSLRHLFRSKVIGPVINTVALRSPRAVGDTASVRAQILAAMAHAQVPAEEIGSIVGGERSRSQMPLDYLAVHESYGEPRPVLPGVSVRRRLLPQRQPAAPLVVISALTDDRRLRLRAEHRLAPSATARVPEYLSALADMAVGGMR